MPQVRLTNRINPVTGEPEVEVVTPKRNNLNQGSGTSDSDLNNSGSTGGAENSVANNYSASNNQAYYDATKAAKQTNYTDAVAKTQGESEAKMNTGTGASAAVGTSYSWENKSKELAENAYQQKTLEEKQNMLTQRQEMEKNAQQYQTQADMQKYSDNQTAEKVGWTGGYVLDQERQREYMKQSIQAQLYGAMELQKYGYDTAMAAARLSYDANLLTYAQEYYNQAVQNSLNEAQITGVYFSAEVKDMLSQYTIADSKLADSTLTEEEKARAQKVKDTIDNWFSENNISKAGIKTLEAWNAEQSLELQWTQELWTQYNAAMESAKSLLEENTDAFIMLDDNGNPIYDGNKVKTNNWNTISGKEIVENYLSDDESGQRRQQFFSYLDRQLTNESVANFTNWLKSEGYMDENGKVSGDYKDLYGEFLGQSDSIGTFLQKKFSNLDDNDKKILEKTLNGYDLTINLPNGEVATYTLNITEGKINNSVNNSVNKTSTEQSSNHKGDFGLSKTYTENSQDAMLNELFKTNNKGELVNENFETLIELIDGCTESNPDTWDETNGWWNGLARGSNPILSNIFMAVESWATAGSNSEKRNAVDEMLKQINTSLGEENLTLLKNIADKWTNMSDRDKALLTEKQRTYYEKATNFMTKITQLKEARDFYDRNDSVPFTWDYVGDTWSQVGAVWSNVDSFGDFIGGVGTTAGAVVTSIVSGVGGFFKNLFTWSW